MRIFPPMGRALSYIFSLFGSSIQESADGVLALLNNAGTGFDRLCFGPPVVGSPSIRRLGATVLGFLTGDATAFVSAQVGSLFLTTAASSGGAGVTSLGSTVATTVGAAGAAAALPAAPVGYMIINVGGTQMKLPYYNT
jgi:hypothetical protein